METLTLENSPAKTNEDFESGTITFVAYKPKTQLPITCRPMNDKSGRLRTGQGERGYYELLTEEEKRSLPFVFDHETSMIIEDGKVLDLDDPYFKAVWNGWLKYHPYISVDKDLGLKTSREAVFYVANEKKEAKQRIKQSEKIDEARPAVRKLSQADQVRVAKALGLESANTFSPEQVLDYLLDKCNRIPETVLATIDPGNKAQTNANIFAGEIIKWKVISREKDGVYYLGGKEGIALGHTKEMVVSYLLDPENSERVRALKAKLTEFTKVKQD